MPNIFDWFFGTPEKYEWTWAENPDPEKDDASTPGYGEESADTEKDDVEAFADTAHDAVEGSAEHDGPGEGADAEGEGGEGEGEGDNDGEGGEAGADE